MVHLPVLKKEVLKYLNPKPNQNFIDATIGGAGHTTAILEAIKPNGRVLGIERDRELYQKLQTAGFGKRLILINDNFVNLKKIVEAHSFKPVQGILFDPGMSLWHLRESGRGFSFLKNEPLDMRFDTKEELTAADIVNKFPETKLKQILTDYGEERFSSRIARKIVEFRKYQAIKTTFQLKELIRAGVPKWYCQGRLHYATRTFQALRIAVNNELNFLAEALSQAVEILAVSGRLVVISFHSLEDRLVKNFINKNVKKGVIRTLTPKPLRPTENELKINLRSRSAKMRVAERPAAEVASS